MIPADLGYASAGNGSNHNGSGSNGQGNGVSSKRQSSVLSCAELQTGCCPGSLPSIPSASGAGLLSDATVVSRILTLSPLLGITSVVGEMQLYRKEGGGGVAFSTAARTASSRYCKPRV